MTAATQYTREVGRKFYADGSPRLFPGNTIICFVAPASPVGRAAIAFQEDLGRQPYGAKFTLLPPASLHMTVMELLCDQVRAPERWSAQLALDVDLVASDGFFLERVPALPAPTGLTMQVDGLFSSSHVMLTLQPGDAAVGAALRAYRAAVVAATGVRFPDHDSYGFHISLAYRLVELTPDEERALAELNRAWTPRLREAGAAVALPPPQLTFFDDMTRFVTAPERHTLRSRARPGQSSAEAR